MSDPNRTEAEPDQSTIVLAPSAAQAHDGEDPVTSQIEQPAKVMRIGTMIKQLLEEVRAAPWTRRAGPG